MKWIADTESSFTIQSGKKISSTGSWLSEKLKTHLHEEDL
jgi:hypothetical protein